MVHAEDYAEFDTGLSLADWTLKYMRRHAKTAKIAQVSELEELHYIRWKSVPGVFSSLSNTLSSAREKETECKGECLRTRP